MIVLNLQGSISFVDISSENFQNLEAKDYIKENLLDILLRGEKVADYVSKQFKQKKKKRLYKGI